MNKKIVSIALCTAMAVSAFAFIGCEGEGSAHKHTYEKSYVLARCETDGYTLHTCKSCGYKYADEFVDAYGHAYEYCVGVALHQDRPSAQADEHGTHLIDYSELIGQPLSAICKDQKDLAKSFLETLMGQAYANSQSDQNTLTFHFLTHHDCAYCDDGGVSVKTIEVPILSVLPIPAFEIPEIPATEFEMVVTAPADDWHDDHGFGKWDLPSKLVGNASTVVSAPTPYHFDPSSKTLTISAKKLENVTVPDGVEKIRQLVASDAFEEIGANVFAQFSGLRRGDLPVGVKKIGENAFGAAVFDYIVIPDTVESIGKNAFGNCSNMKCVFYMGTAEQWNGVEIADGNDGFKNAPRYYYSQEKPQTKGNYWHFVDESPVVW